MVQPATVAITLPELHPPPSNTRSVLSVVLLEKEKSCKPLAELPCVQNAASERWNTAPSGGPEQPDARYFKRPPRDCNRRWGATAAQAGPIAIAPTPGAACAKGGAGGGEAGAIGGTPRPAGARENACKRSARPAKDTARSREKQATPNATNSSLPQPMLNCIAVRCMRSLNTANRRKSAK